MTMHNVRRRNVVALMLSPLLAAAASRGGGAQVFQRPRGTEEVITGDNVGFRVDHYDRKGRPVGTLVVKRDDKWIDVEFAAKLRPAR
jgi:hypothetical protein